MSSKSNPKKETERDKERIRKLPPMEAIITRNKSALLKRQLRTKEASIKKISEITQLLKNSVSQKATHKSPVKTQKESQKESQKTALKSPPQKAKQSSPKKDMVVAVAAKKLMSPAKRKKIKLSKKKKVVNASKTQEVGNGEFCPNKLKRNVITKKIILKPKHELKLIGSKRKMAVPHRGIASPCKRSRCESPNMDQLIQEADQTLSDEDLMEILTCPSPVWWESPSQGPSSDNEEYFFNITPPLSPVDEICPTRSSPMPKTEPVAEILKEAEQKIAENKNKDEKFMKKRSVLENLLGNIKNKSNFSEKRNVSKSKMELDSEIKSKFDDCSTTTNKDKPFDNIIKQITETSLGAASESTEDDDLFSLRDENFLEDLENIIIPVKEDIGVKQIKNEESPDNTLSKEISFNKLNDISVFEKSIEQKFKQGDCKRIDNKRLADLKSDNVDEEDCVLVMDKIEVINVDSYNETGSQNIDINIKNVNTNETNDVNKVDEESENHVTVGSICNEIIVVKNEELPDNNHDTQMKFQDANTNRGVKSKKPSPRKNKVISFEPHGLPVENLDTVMLKDNRKPKQTDKKSVETQMTDKPKTSGIKIQKSKPDIMTVYKIICQDKFPLEKDAQEKDSNTNKEKTKGIASDDVMDNFMYSVNNSSRNDRFCRTYQNTSRRNKNLADGNDNASSQSVTKTCNENQNSSEKT